MNTSFRTLVTRVCVVGIVLGMWPSLGFSAQKSATLRITHAFTEETVFEETVSFDQENVMEILRQHADVVTGYAGGFIHEINGVGSSHQGGIRKDWFYYVNGIMAHVGALGYSPGDGDVVWWDYHRWHEALSVPSVIGAYPQPFVNGYRGDIPPTVILSTAALRSSATALRESLKARGVQQIEVQRYENRIPDYSQYFYMLIGDWASIKDDELINDMVTHHRTSGFFIHVEDSRLTALNVAGEKKRSFEKGAAILAVGSGFQAKPPLWVITGTDDAEVTQAVDLLVSHSERIQGYSAAVLSHGELTNVPVFSND